MLDTPWWYRYIRNWRLRMWLETGQAAQPLSSYSVFPPAQPRAQLAAPYSSTAAGPHSAQSA